jgi:hypothetical protein
MSLGMRGAVLVAGAVLVNAPLVGEAEIPGLRSRATLAAPDLDFELREASIAPDGEVWAAVTARPRGNPVGAESYVLATFDARSQVTRKPLQLPGADVNTSRRAARRRVLEDMEVTADGRLAFALARGAAPAPLAVMRADARDASPLSPPAMSTDVDVQELVVAPGGRLLAVGSSGNHPVVAEIAADPDRRRACDS